MNTPVRGVLWLHIMAFCFHTGSPPFMRRELAARYNALVVAAGVLSEDDFWAGVMGERARGGAGEGGAGCWGGRGLGGQGERQEAKGHEAEGQETKGHEVTRQGANHMG